MSLLLRRVHDIAALRRDVDADLTSAMMEARSRHSLREIADAAMMSRGGVQWRVGDLKRRYGKEYRESIKEGS